MAATSQDIKDFLALSGNNPNVSNTKMTRLKAALGAKINLDGSPAEEDQLVDYVYQHLVDLTVRHEKEAAAKAAESGVTF